MPIYEYKCPFCDHKFQRLIKVDAAKPPCPRCDWLYVEKLVSRGSFALKGGGWEKDGYVKNNKGETK
jgi:putative FmdB family regulatory protein|tara:strand:+ start:108 stop:308 length:201 start_codon:yes stop_codon:yes gene_type:complete